MAILVIAEHDNSSIKAATLHAVTAATKLGGEIHLLVAGSDCADAAAAAARISGVGKVLLVDAPHYASAVAGERRGTGGRHGRWLLASAGGRDDRRQELHAARRSAARRRADLGNLGSRVA
jgi:hypothetical protein